VNLALLMAVAFLSFPTRLMAEAIRDVNAERAAVIFYGGSLLVISLLLAALWATAARARRLFKPEVTQQEIDALRPRHGRMSASTPA
jgi:putative copper export protein